MITRLIPPMLYPTAYKWFVLVSAVDIVLSWFILLLGGSEVSVIADVVITSTGLKGMLIYKFCLMILVVLSCEIIGRRRPRPGRNLARAAITISPIPVVLSIVQLIVPM